ncbi:conserved hypothetical protein [Burkholderia diffusa]|uniref:hypothetical protein n=1 Tax=Burkholderia diffusa TaxID=488732 RepID=UPI001CAC257C|nr:hypothetical protein [Burkholderia diffusa]CAG9264251.1 conserved hypothetical protein [Burkholderia diffusa]
MSLLDAATVLDDLAKGRTPDPAKLVSGALALETLNLNGQSDRDLLDAEAGLKALATGGSLDRDETGRSRSAHLERVVRLAAINAIRQQLDK